MKHINDDDLLKRVLQLLPEDALTLQEAHLIECARCRAALDRMKRETEFIGSLEPEIGEPRLPLPKTRGAPLSRILKIAALLAIGFMAGYGFSASSRTAVVTVIPHRVHSTQPTPSSTGFMVCE